jgi:hypothetical protein
VAKNPSLETEGDGRTARVAKASDQQEVNAKVERLFRQALDEERLLKDSAEEWIKKELSVLGPMGQVQDAVRELSARESAFCLQTPVRGGTDVDGRWKRFELRLAFGKAVGFRPPPEHWRPPFPRKRGRPSLEDLAAEAAHGIGLTRRASSVAELIRRWVKPRAILENVREAIAKTPLEPEWLSPWNRFRPRQTAILRLNEAAHSHRIDIDGRDRALSEMSLAAADLASDVVAVLQKPWVEGGLGWPVSSEFLPALIEQATEAAGRPLAGGTPLRPIDVAAIVLDVAEKVEGWTLVGPAARKLDQDDG